MRARVTARETVNPDVQCAGVLESADSRALKALGPQGREGSSPSSGTLLSCGFSERSAFAADAVVVAVQPEGVGSAHRDGALDVVGAVARASGAVVVADAVVEARVGVGGVGRRVVGGLVVGASVVVVASSVVGGEVVTVVAAVVAGRSVRRAEVLVWLPPAIAPMTTRTRTRPPTMMPIQPRTPGRRLGLRDGGCGGPQPCGV